MICPEEDVDWFKFNVSSGGAVNLTLTDLPADYDVWLYSSSKGDWVGSYNGGTADEHVQWKAEGDDLLYVLIYGYDGATSNRPYALVASLLPPAPNGYTWVSEDEYNYVHGQLVEAIREWNESLTFQQWLKDRVIEFGSDKLIEKIGDMAVQKGFGSQLSQIMGMTHSFLFGTRADVLRNKKLFEDRLFIMEARWNLQEFRHGSFVLLPWGYRDLPVTEFPLFWEFWSDWQFWNLGGRANPCPDKPRGDADCLNGVGLADYDYYRRTVIFDSGIPASVNPDFNADGKVGTKDGKIVLETVFGSSVSDPNHYGLNCPTKAQGDADCRDGVNLVDYDYYRRVVLFDTQVPNWVNADFDGDGEVSTNDGMTVLRALGILR
jgi:hypothetical protein